MTRRLVDPGPRVTDCERCGEQFEQERKQGRPFRYCESCRPAPALPVASEAVARCPGVDPPVRPDGICARPGCGRPRKLTKVARKYAGAQLDLDPFCSSVCCRRFHGVDVGGDDDLELAEKRSAGARRQNEERKLLAGIAA